MGTSVVNRTEALAPAVVHCPRSINFRGRYPENF